MIVRRIADKIRTWGGFRASTARIFSFTKEHGFRALYRVLRNFKTTSEKSTDQVGKFELRKPEIFSGKQTYIFENNNSLQPVVSVVIPCYGQSEFLESALMSVAKATDKPHECIVVDDGNKSRSQKMTLSLLASQAPHQSLTIVSKANGGLSSARNVGASMARGDFIKFLDADDLLLQGSLDLEILTMRRKKSDVHISDYAYWNEDSGYFKVSKPWTTKRLEMDTNRINSISLNTIFTFWEQGLSIPIHSALFKSETIINFDERLKSKEDFNFWLNYFSKNRRVSYSSKVNCIYRGHNKQMTKNNVIVNGAFLCQVIFMCAHSEIALDIKEVKSKLNHVRRTYGDEALGLWASSSPDNALWLMGLGIGRFAI